MSEAYSEALKKAQEELAECVAQIDDLERKRAKLTQTVSALQNLTGIVATRSVSLTDSILTVLKASPDYMSASRVVRSLINSGFDPAQGNSVATILSRLVKDGRIVSKVDAAHVTGYAWKTETTEADTKGE